MGIFKEIYNFFKKCFGTEQEDVAPIRERRPGRHLQEAPRDQNQGAAAGCEGVNEKFKQEVAALDQGAELFFRCAFTALAPEACRPIEPSAASAHKRPRRGG